MDLYVSHKHCWRSDLDG